MDIVKNELKIMQTEYLNLLKKIKSSMNDNFYASIDEINIFWLRKKNFVMFLLKEYFPAFNTFLFTGATFLDCNQNEQFPFVVCNGVRIIDDNICSYGNMIENIENEIFNQTIKQQLILSIDDNIEILEKYSDYIYILPVHYLNDEDELIYKSAENVFLNLFKNDFVDLNDYFTNITTIEDLEKNLCLGVEKNLKFCDDDNNKLTLKERLRNFVESSNKNYDFSNKPINFIFFSSVFSHISRTLNIIQICFKFRLIPYLRYSVIFHHFCYLLENFNQQEEFKVLKFKAYTCHLIYKSFDLDSVNESIFFEFAQKVKENKVYETTYNKLINKKDYEPLQKISDYVQEQFQLIIDKCK